MKVDLMKRRSRKLTNQKLITTFTAVRRHGSSAEAARKLGISRQAVEQRLNKGAERGLFQWENPQRRIDSKRLAKIISEAGSIREAVELAGVAPATLRNLAKRFHMSRQLEALKNRHSEQRTQRCKAQIYRDYLAFRHRLRREPTTYNLQQMDRALYGRILYHYGSIANFRKAHGIAAPEMHRRKRLVRRARRIPAHERRNYVLKQYDALVGKLGHHPSTFEMTDPMYPERAHLYRLILKEWRTFTAFRHVLHIPKNAVGVRASKPENALVPRRVISTSPRVEEIRVGGGANGVGNSTTRSRHARMLNGVREYIESLGYTVCNYRITPAGQARPLRTDLFIKELNALLEVKSTISPSDFTKALGQLINYARYLQEPHCVILVPSNPGDDLRALARANNVYVMWPEQQNYYEGFDQVCAARASRVPRLS